MDAHYHPAHDPDCLFCKIVAKKIPSRPVYEDEDFYASTTSPLGRQCIFC